MDLLDKGFGALGDLVRAEMPAGILTDLLVDGIIAGVGGVMVFLPQILLLFLFISILEDTGYMARAAFLLDKLMSRVGLHGKAFLPLMSSFACAIPGHYGDADDREQPRQVCDDPDRSVDELFGSAAGLHADDRGVFCGADGLWIYFARRGADARDVCARDLGRGYRRVYSETHGAESSAAAVSDGTAAVPAAQFSDRFSEYAHACVAVRKTGRNRHPGDLDHSLGVDVFSARRSQPSQQSSEQPRQANNADSYLRASSSSTALPVSLGMLSSR